MTEGNRRDVAILAGMFAGLYPYFYDSSRLASFLVFWAVATGMYVIIGIMRNNP